MRESSTLYGFRCCVRLPKTVTPFLLFLFIDAVSLEFSDKGYRFHFRLESIPLLGDRGWQFDLEVAKDFCYTQHSRSSPKFVNHVPGSKRFLITLLQGIFLKFHLDANFQQQPFQLSLDYSTTPLQNRQDTAIF